MAHGVTLFVGVDPLSPGTKVTVEQLVKGKWKKVATKKLSKKGYAKFSFKPRAKGTYTYRIYAPADRRSEGNTSRKVKVTLS